MLTAVITALLFIVMLLIVASFVASALREHRRHLRMQAVRVQDWYDSPERQVTAVLKLQAGTVVGIEEPDTPFHLSLPPSWYRRRRTIVSIGLLLMLLLTLF